MIPFVRKAGVADQSVVIRIIDSTAGTPEEAVEHDTAGIALWYRRSGATKTAITPAALAALDSAHSDGGIEHIDDGYYRLDLPDAAVAAGVTEVVVGGTVTGMVVLGAIVQLVGCDITDGVRLGLTALPNAAPDAAGGLPVSDAGGLDLDTLLGRLDAAITTRHASGAAVAKSPATLAEADVAGNLPVNVVNWKGSAAPAMTGDAFARLGAPAGASVSADVADIKTQIGVAGAGLSDIPKTGFKLASDGLDSVATTAPSGVASNFREMLVQVWRRFFKKATQTATELKTYADDGSTVLTTQTLSDDGTTQTQGAAT